MNKCRVSVLSFSFFFSLSSLLTLLYSISTLHLKGTLHAQYVQLLVSLSASIHHPSPVRLHFIFLVFLLSVVFSPESRFEFFRFFLFFFFFPSPLCRSGTSATRLADANAKKKIVGVLRGADALGSSFENSLCTRVNRIPSTALTGNTFEFRNRQLNKIKQRAASERPAVPPVDRGVVRFNVLSSSLSAYCTSRRTQRGTRYTTYC